MSGGQTLILGRGREVAHRLVDAAPPGHVLQITAPRRSDDANRKMWAMLSDISRAQPEGRRHTAEDWKAIFMNACGWEVQFIEGLDGRPFPSGFRSSRMTKRQMADLITFIQEYGDRHLVQWTEPHGLNEAA